MYRMLEYFFYIIMFLVIALLFIIIDDKSVLVKNYTDSVVMITSDSGRGTGFYIGDGYVITAAHVVANQADYKIETQENDVFSVEIIEKFTEYDVAVLKLDVIPSYLVSVDMTCQDPEIGTELHSVGNPQVLEFAHVWGKVSYPRIDDLFDRFKRVFVVDMTIVPGQSGAPLFNDNGKVEGIISSVMIHAINAQAPNIVGYGYGIPSSVICELAGEYYER